MLFYSLVVHIHLVFMLIARFDFSEFASLIWYLNPGQCYLGYFLYSRVSTS